MPFPALMLGLIAALMFGVSIGSFLNVVIWRVPRGQSVSSPTWSYCPNCHTRLSGWDLVPLLSFLALGRKCRYCKQPISWRYFLVEALTGLLYVGVFLRPGCGWSIDTIFYCLFLSVLVCVFFTDLDSFIIPDELNVAGVVIGLALNITHFWIDGPAAEWSFGGFRLIASIPSALFSALFFNAISLAGYIYYSSTQDREPVAEFDASIVRETRQPLSKRLGVFVLGIFEDYAYLIAKFTGLGLLSPKLKAWIVAHDPPFEEDSTGYVAKSEAASPSMTREEIAEEIESDDEQTGMGHGDAKLAASIGAVLLFKYAMLSFFIAILIGGLYGIVMLATQKRRGSSAIPFGPYMVVGAVIAFFFGAPILQWYQHYAFPATVVR